MHPVARLFRAESYEPQSGELYLEPDYLDISEEISPKDKSRWYEMTSVFAHLVGDYRQIVEFRRRTGKVPWHSILRAVHSFTKGLGLRSVVEFSVAQLPHLFGVNEEWEYQADRDLDLLFFCLSLPFTSSSGKGRFQNASRS